MPAVAGRATALGCFTGKCLSVLSAEGGTYGGQGEEGDPQEGEAGGQEPPLPGARGLIAVADGG